MNHALDTAHPPAIAVEGLSKTYAGGKVALDAVTLDIPRGSIFGLLGPNGAGKSTLINILAGTVNKTSGSASVWGFDITRDPRNAKRSIGIVPQEIMFDPFFTPRETLDNQAGFYGVAPGERITDELLRAVRLEDKADAYARTLSGGMKRRLMVAKAMVHSPPIIVLDEPTAGVDIELRQQLWDYVRSLNAEGVTVVLTTHYLEEAEELCDRIAIINHGKLIADKPTRELVAMGREKTVVVTLGQDVDALPQGSKFEKVEAIGERQIAITFDIDKATAGEVITAVQAGHYDIIDVTTREADLEDVFLKLTRENNAAG
ncbi:MAG: ABC transporter ATP-binding protein [Sphingomonadales bacterium]|nr:ABC transporter ATP-binding protein [Sphingomonadales bacterium]